MERKICNKCNIEMDISNFHKDKTKKYGVTNQCKECKKITNKIWNACNIEKKKELYEKWRLKNIENRRTYLKEYKKKNWSSILIQINKRDKERKKTDPLYKLKLNIRSRTRNFLKKKNILKTDAIFKIIGCTPEELKIHLENQFIEKMCWENHGFYGWHIDHIVPLDSGCNEEEILKLCHYTNLQPLWWSENLSKGYKVL